MKLLSLQLATLLLLLSTNSIYAQEIENQEYFQWPTKLFKGYVHGLGTPLPASQDGGLIQMYFHEGLDIVASAGEKVYSPIKADQIMISPNEDFNIHLINLEKKITVILNHLDLERVLRKFESLNENQVYDMEIEQGEEIGLVSDGYGSYLNHLHLEVRNHATDHLIDPAPFFEEIHEKDSDPPIIGEIRISDGGSLRSDRDEPMRLTDSNSVEFLVDIADFVTGNVETKTMPLGESNKKLVSMEKLELPAQRVLFYLNQELVRSIDMSRMKAQCSVMPNQEVHGPEACHNAELSQDPSNIFYTHPSPYEYTTLPGAFFVPREADDVDEMDLGDPFFHRRYIYRSGIVPERLFKDGNNELKIEAIDAAGNASSKTIVFHVES